MVPVVEFSILLLYPCAILKNRVILNKSHPTSAVLYLDLPVSIHLKLFVMAQKILVTNFTFSVSPKEFEAMATELAPAFADVPGCMWKLWLIDKEAKQAGAVYLFKDEKALQTFKESSLVASVLSHPALSKSFSSPAKKLTVSITIMSAPSIFCLA